MDKKILDKLRELKPILNEKFGIEEFAVFGSYAKGKETKDSDIDIAILKIRNKRLALRLEAIDLLKKELNIDIDMGYYNSMKTFIKNRIQKDFIYV
ncbi:MAG: nucleotidyltransferase domain-containing protein [Campylobacterales bacterium]